MNAKHKQFILKKLIPFILREQGAGFLMSTIRLHGKPGDIVQGDGIIRALPKCGTAACIYGSIEVLKGKRMKPNQAGRVIGLSEDEADGLFYNWQKDPLDDYCWPDWYSVRFDNARTPLAKAEVAVALLRKIVNTKGKCLHATPADGNTSKVTP